MVDGACDMWVGEGLPDSNWAVAVSRVHGDAGSSEKQRAYKCHETSFPTATRSKHKERG